jgi:uncharacterized protein (TIGR02453 family)
MAKTYFTPELFQFLKQLKRNNRREWFLENKPRYEALLRQPSLQFITDFSMRAREISPWLVVSPKPMGGSLMRIYRDIRFSKDKTPYKTNVGMHFGNAGSKDGIHGASLYLHLAPGESFVAGGCWHPDPKSLARIRDAIAWKSDEWKAATHRLRLGGDGLTRPPRGYRADHPMIEDLKRTDFVASIEFSDTEVCGARFMSEVVAAGKKMTPMLKFLSQAVGLRF